MAGGTMNMGMGTGGSVGDANGLMDPLYAGQTRATAYNMAVTTLPSALQSYQTDHTAADGTNYMDPDLIQRAMRYVMNMPLETQYYETGPDTSNPNGGYVSVKPMSYSSREQMDFIDQHEKDKKAYDTLTKGYKAKTSSGNTSLLSSDDSTLSLYKTLLGGTS